MEVTSSPPVGATSRYFARSACHLLTFVRLVRGGEKVDEAVEGFGDDGAELRVRGDHLLSLLHPLVAGQEQRLGVGEFLLASGARRRASTWC